MRKVFYSFHYDNDVWRVQQIRNMGKLEHDEPVLKNEWEEIKKQGNYAIKQWIDNAMDRCSCLVVLIGSQTSERQWVQYEIKRAFETKKGILGIYIHNLGDRQSRTCYRGQNPFEMFSFYNGFNKIQLSDVVQCYDPMKYAPVVDIKNHIEKLVEEAIYNRRSF